MVCSSSPYHFKICKGCRPQILLGSFLNTLSHMPTAVMRNDTPAVVTIMLNRHVRGSFKTIVILCLEAHGSFTQSFFEVFQNNKNIQ